jgi:hypothetical protein
MNKPENNWHFTQHSALLLLPLIDGVPVATHRSDKGLWADPAFYLAHCCTPVSRIWNFHAIECLSENKKYGNRVSDTKFGALTRLNTACEFSCANFVKHGRVE